MVVGFFFYIVIMLVIIFLLCDWCKFKNGSDIFLDYFGDKGIIRVLDDEFDN